MTFEVKYRNAKGEIDYISIDAEDRAKLFEELRNLKISAIQVVVQNGKSRYAKPRKAASSGAPISGKIKGLVALVAVCVISVVVWLCVSKDKPEKPVDEVANLRKMVPSQTPGSISIVQRQTDGEELRQTNEVKSELPVTNVARRLHNGVEVVSEMAITNRAGAIIEKLTLADGTRADVVHPPRSIFHNASDQVLAMVLSVKPGQPIPPLPALGSLDEDFAKSLLEPIVVDDGDSDSDREMKLAVKEARAYIASAIKEGRSVQSCIGEYVSMLNRASDSHQMAVNEIKRLRDAGASREEIEEFRGRINEFLREKDIPELPDYSKKKGE